MLSGTSNPNANKVQISRWVTSGKLIQVRRGVYLISEPYRKIEIYEPYLASIVKKPSYISLEKALEYHGLIPEAVAKYTSLTTKRPGLFVSQAGVFEYRHIKQSLFWGYKSVTVNKQTGFFASPEKALLDYFYFNGVEATTNSLEEMRFQNLEMVNLSILDQYAQRFNKPGVLRVAGILKKYIDSVRKEEKIL